MVPAAALGALITHWNKNWTFAEAVDRICIGMGSVLSTVALGNLAWQLIFHTVLPQLQLLLLLIIAALSAAFSVGSWASNYIINGMLWGMTRIRSVFMAFIVVLGGTLGFLLALGPAFGWSMPLGILVGVAVAVALALRMDHLV